MLKKEKNLIIYQAKTGAIEFKGDFNQETIWGSLNQIADLFGRDKSVISRHIKNIYRTQELIPSATVAKIATAQQEGQREVIREIEYYNLDVILSVGYRVDSKQATQFRQWATKTLRQYIINGYTINPKRISQNYEQFLKAVEDVKKLLPAHSKLPAGDVLELIKTFANTWFSLDAYDKSALPNTGISKKQVEFTSQELEQAILTLKENLIATKEATNLFAQQKRADNLAGIVGNVFQSVFGKNVYPTLEEKAAHLLYFIIKNHPFADGNKRSGAFAFVWFLRKANLLDTSRISPEALTVITLLIAESNPKEKERIVGLVLLLIRKK